MRKAIASKLAKVFPRGNKTECSKDDWTKDHSQLLRAGTPLPFGARGTGLNTSNGPSQFGSVSPDLSALPLSRESTKFIQHVSVASLSQVLIWYLYNDIVPITNSSRHWYLELPREQMLGWIRFGSELGRGIALHNARQLPIRLQQTIDELGLETRDVCRRLIRMSNAQEMRRHEMAEFDFVHSSSYFAAGDKLEADRRLLGPLRPISKTVWADWQDVTLNWIETFMEFVIRPAVDPLKERGRSLKASTQKGDTEVRKLFRKVCAHHIDSPLTTIYTQAFPKQYRSHPEDSSSLPYGGARSAHEQAWSLGNARMESHFASPFRGSRQRRSAPMLDKDDIAITDLEERLDDLREDMDALLSEKIKTMQHLQHPADGRLSRAECRISQAARRLSQAYGMHDAKPQSKARSELATEPNTESVYSEDDLTEVGVDTGFHCVPGGARFTILNPRACRSATDLHLHAMTSRSMDFYNASSMSRPDFNRRSLANLNEPAIVPDPFSTPTRRARFADDNSSVQVSDNEDIYHGSSERPTTKILNRRHGVVFHDGLHIGRQQEHIRTLNLNEEFQEARMDSAHANKNVPDHAFERFSSGHCSPEKRMGRTAVMFGDQLEIVHSAADGCSQASSRRCATPTVPEKSNDMDEENTNSVIKAGEVEEAENSVNDKMPSPERDEGETSSNAADRIENLPVPESTGAEDDIF